MIKSFTLLISAFFLICSCNNPTTTKEIVAQDNVDNNKAEIAKLNDFLKKYEEPSQKFKVATDKPSVVTGRKGTKISINPNDLITESGKPIGQNIEIELKELTNQGQLFRTNTQTVSDGKLLVSGGAYFINMSSNGEQLRLKESKKLNVQFPKLTNKEMELFYGQKNDLGQVNWVKTAEIFKSSPTKAKAVIDTIVTKRKNVKSDIDAIMDYVDSVDVSSFQEEVNNNAPELMDNRIHDKLYNDIGISKLGWINCDRFLEEETTDFHFSFHPQDSRNTVSVFIIFKDINSVFQEFYFAKEKLLSLKLPIGHQVKIIAYTIINEKIFAYSSDVKILKGQKLTLNLKEINEKDFEKIIMK